MDASLPSNHPTPNSILSSRSILPSLSSSAQGEDPEDALWVVLKWEGLAPLALYPATQQTSGLGLGRLFGAADRSMLDRARMIRWGVCVLLFCFRSFAACRPLLSPAPAALPGSRCHSASRFFPSSSCP